MQETQETFIGEHIVGQNGIIAYGAKRDIVPFCPIGYYPVLPHTMGQNGTSCFARFAQFGLFITNFQIFLRGLVLLVFVFVLIFRCQSLITKTLTQW